MVELRCDTLYKNQSHKLRSLVISIKMYDNLEMGVINYDLQIFENIHYNVSTAMVIITPVDIWHGIDYIAV